MPNAILSTEPIPLHVVPVGNERGAEVTFLGLVRGSEKGEPIQGIRYSAYEPMALRMLEELVAEASEHETAHEVFIQHRLGPVLVGEPSVIIRVCSKHSAAAFERCQYYLAKLKTQVPIWKEIMPPSSTLQ
jgi:molybdopterin synthase catalytic subunit